MKRPPLRAILPMLLLACLSSAACVNSNKVSRTQAQQVWHALVKQSDPANAAALMGVAETSGCKQGGQQIKRMGLLSVRGDNLQMRATLHYDDCVVDKTRFDGELFVGIRSSSAARNSTSHYESTLSGELTLPGHVRCAVDLSSTRDMTGNNQAAQYTGTFCGHDAATLGL